MNASIDIGTDSLGASVQIDIEELLATRLLVQGNSGSGKSHLLRRVLEESAGLVQQIVIDPEGDFVTLADAFDHVVIDAGAYDAREIVTMAARAREHRASVVLALDNLELEAQMRCAAAFLSTLFDAPRAHWYPALVVVDEAQMFAPAVAGDVSDETRRLSLGAMTNLMCRGRKRGLAGIIATQRLAKLAKNVAAEASNFLMGRTFLDIDMARAADLLGMERKQAEAIRDLDRGQFLALGPAICRRPVAVRIGAVQTATRMGTHSLLPLPTDKGSSLQAMLFDPVELDAPPPAPPPPPASAEILDRVSANTPVPLASDDAADLPELPVWPLVQEIAADPDCAFQSMAALYQDFAVRCRMQKMPHIPLGLPDFQRHLAMAMAGIPDPADPDWQPVIALAGRVPDDMLAPFLLIAGAALQGRPCPDDDRLAQCYGTRSPGRVRRLIDHMEKSGLIVVRTDFGGRRSIGVPDLGLTTAASDA
ncbi:MAG: helicase HerA domain-containing protein [Chakrabartia sp.]